jgi:hypothetical protein
MRRTWLSCYIMDKNLSAQLGKPSVCGVDAAILSVPDTPTNSIEDKRVYTQLELTHILTRGLESIRYHAPKGPDSLFSTDIPAEYAVLVERQLDHWKEKWAQNEKWAPQTGESSLVSPEPELRERRRL